MPDAWLQQSWEGEPPEDPHFADEDSKAQKDPETCLRSLRHRTRLPFQVPPIMAGDLA